jgi:hypothetical protein
MSAKSSVVVVSNMILLCIVVFKVRMTYYRDISSGHREKANIPTQPFSLDRYFPSVRGRIQLHWDHREQHCGAYGKPTKQRPFLVGLVEEKCRKDHHPRGGMWSLRQFLHSLEVEGRVDGL